MHFKYNYNIKTYKHHYKCNKIHRVQTGIKQHIPLLGSNHAKDAR